MNYLAWNDAIGHHFFHAGNAGRSITLYLDRRRIEMIGHLHELGGWDEFLASVRGRIDLGNGVVFHEGQDPVEVACELGNMWFGIHGKHDSSRMETTTFPPILMGLGILVLAWTEGEDSLDRSYYSRVRNFCIRFVFSNGQRPSHAYKHTKNLIMLIHRLKTWIESQFGSSFGILLDRQLSAYPYVGTIRFHALFDGKERDLLPELWHRIGLMPKREISGKRLVELAAKSEHWERDFPNLSRVIARSSEQDLSFVETLVLSEFESWEGDRVVKEQRMYRPTTPKPQLLIHFENALPSKIQIEWLQDIGILNGELGEFLPVKQDGQPLYTLVDAYTKRPVIPDHKWLFDEVKLVGSGTSVYRAARDHFWMWPCNTLGYHMGGFLELKQPQNSGVFRLVVRGEAIAITDAWRKEKHAVQGSDFRSIGNDVWVLKGAYPQWDPFASDKGQKQSKDSNLLRLNGLQDQTGAYMSDYPCMVSVDSGCIEGWNIEVHGCQHPIDATLLRKLDDSTAIFPITYPPFDGSCELLLKDRNGIVVEYKKVKFSLAEPRKHFLEDRSLALDHHEEWILPEEVSKDPNFLGNQFSRRSPSHRNQVHCLFLPDERQELDAVKGLELGFILAAAPRENGNLSNNDWNQLLDHLANSVEKPIMTASQKRHLRATMQSMGHLHYHHKSARLMVAPMRLCLLPDDFHSIRALLLGPLPATVLRFLIRWSRISNSAIQFDWVHQEQELVPPMLLLRTNNIYHFVGLCNAINSHFPDAISFNPDQCLAWDILKWHAPLPPAPPYHSHHGPDWTSFPVGSMRWDLFQCSFRQGGLTTKYPMLTQTKDPITQRKGWIWWTDRSTGYEVMHHNCIPALHAHHGLPFIAQNAEKTDEILIPAGYRQHQLIERALVLASGKLPRTIQVRQVPSWKGLFSPTALWKVFSGIRPPLRCELKRIFSNAFPKHAELKIPFVEIQY